MAKARKLPVRRNPVARALRDPRFRGRTVPPLKGKGSYERKGRARGCSAPSDSGVHPCMLALSSRLVIRPPNGVLAHGFWVRSSGSTQA